MGEVSGSGSGISHLESSLTTHRGICVPRLLTFREGISFRLILSYRVALGMDRIFAASATGTPGSFCGILKDESLFCSILILFLIYL